METAFFMELLGIDSTSGGEGPLRERVMQYLNNICGDVRTDSVGNLIASWGDPKVVFCSHLDTVPPYIAPTSEGRTISGRGTCDAKGQWFGMMKACERLLENGESNFALLLTAGEETGSTGARRFDYSILGNPQTGRALLIGEPTEGIFVSAAKGTRSFSITIHGRSCHSGYPEKGDSAIGKFIRFNAYLESIDFPEDQLMGATTWNIGNLTSPNPKNIVSGRVSFDIFFRTTAASHEAVIKAMKDYASQTEGFKCEDKGGDTPAEYFVPEGYEGSPSAFGTDAPHLNGFTFKSIYGPGSILDAHTDHEKINLDDIEKAVEVYVDFYHRMSAKLGVES